MNAVTFDQNWDTLHYYHTVNGVHVPYSRIVVHANYYGVVGWLHFKNQQQPLTDDQKEQQIRFILAKQESSKQHLVEIKQVLA